jgi:hypothetical protein
MAPTAKSTTVNALRLRSEGDAIAEPAWLWDAAQQDAKFRTAMLAAIASGAETCATSPSTALGTRMPVSNYQRSD